MDWYSLFKFLHVAASIIWIGAGFGLVVLGLAAERSRNNQQFGQVLDQVNFLALRLFMPASVSALVFGLITAFIGAMYGTLWIWLGLIGFAATFVTGNFLIRPRSEELTRVVAAEGYSERAVAKGGEILSIARFDYLMLFVVVADMVFKPGFGDWLLLLIFVLVLAGGAWLFLRPMIVQTAVAVGWMKPGM